MKKAQVGSVRSLHHIDDEDFEDTRDRALARQAAIEERERREQEERASKTPLSAAPIKDDKKKPEDSNEEPDQGESN